MNQKKAVKPGKSLMRGKGPDRILAEYKSQEIKGAVPFVETMVLPEDKSPVRLPDDNISASAVFDAQEVFNVNIVHKWNSETMSTSVVPDDFESIVGVHPRIANSIVQLSSKPSPVLSGGNYRSFDYNTYGGAVYPSFSKGNYALIPRMGISRPVIAVNLQIDDVIEISAPVPWTLYTYDQQFVESATYGYGRGDFKLTRKTVAFSVLLDDEAECRLTLNSAAYSLPAGGTTFEIKGFEDLLDMKQTSMERCTALSLLYTYQGSDLDNGGQIAAARLPPRLNPMLEEADFYGALAELPTYNGDYPLKLGAYVWWMPESSREFDYGLYSHTTPKIPKSTIWVAGNHNVKTVCRARIVAHFETLTRSQQYTTKVSDSNPLLPDLLSMAKTLPAVSENPEHKGFFSKLWGKVKSTVSNPANWLKAAEVGLPYLAALL